MNLLIPWGAAVLALAIGAGGTLYYRGELLACEGSVAIDANSAQERLRLRQQADAEFRRLLSDQLAPVVGDLRKQANDTQTALAKVASNPACVDTAAARAFDRGVRPVPGGGEAGRGQSRQARP